MNFYIFNSKIKKNIFITFALIILFIIFVHVILNIFVSIKTNKNAYLMNIESKTKHMHLNVKENTDIIFIGNSRTLYHISTEVFKQYNINIYNYGISDRTIYNYYQMTKNAIEHNPKIIVISIKLNDIFNKSDYFNRVSLQDISAMFQTNQNSSLIKKALVDYLTNFYELVNYSDVINEKVQGVYKSFTYKTSSNNLADNKNIETDKLKIGDADCKIFDIKYPLNKITVKCTNGDGILFGNKVNEEKHIQYFRKPNIKYVDLLNYIISEIQENNIKPIIVLEPIYHSEYKYDFKKIQDIIHSDIIDFTNIHIPQVMWADNNHLDNKGRILYSNFLAKKLTEKLK